MFKKTNLLLIGFLILFFLFGGFHTDLLANDVSVIEKQMLKKHVIVKESLREARLASSSSRSANIEKLEKHFPMWGIEASLIKTACRTLSDSELEYLVRQSEDLNTNFFGGANTGETLGLITVCAMAAFIVVWEVTGLSAGAEGWN